MEITLHLNGEDKVFVQPFVSGLHYRKVVELLAEEEKKPLPLVEKLDKEVDLVCDSFGNQFKRNDFYNGVSAKNLNKELHRILMVEIFGMPSEDEVQDFLTLGETVDQDLETATP